MEDTTVKENDALRKALKDIIELVLIPPEHRLESEISYARSIYLLAKRALDGKY